MSYAPDVIANLWGTIDTAPQDGTKILVCCLRSLKEKDQLPAHDPIMLVHWTGEHWQFDDLYAPVIYGEGVFTHWYPVPKFRTAAYQEEKP